MSRFADTAPAAAASDAAPPAEFFIQAATSLQERRPRTLKHGDTFAVFDPNGDALSGGDSPEGLYHRDTRYLSRLVLTIGGARPMLLSSTLRDDNATLTCDLTNPDLVDASGHIAMAHDVIHVRRSRFLWNGACFERLAVRNFDACARRLQLEIAFAADFADVFEVRGKVRAARGRYHVPRVGVADVALAYTGIDGVRRETALRFAPTPAHVAPDRARFDLSLAPGATEVLYVEIRCGTSAPA